MGFWEYAGRALLVLQRRQLHQLGGAAASDGETDRLWLAEAAAALQLLTPSVRTAVSPRDVVRCASAQSWVL